MKSSAAPIRFLLTSTALAAPLVALGVAHGGEGPTARTKDERCEWPMGRGNPGLTGVSADRRVRPPFRRRWVHQTPASVIVAGSDDGFVCGFRYGQR